MDCPKCVGKLSKITVNLNKVYRSKSLRGEGLTEEIELDQCFVCKGVWFDAGELEKYLAEKVTIVDSPSIGPKLKKEQDEKIGKCPRCGIDMSKKKAPKDSSVTIDFCQQCKGVWLDNTEIDRLEKAGMGFIHKITATVSRLFVRRRS